MTEFFRVGHITSTHALKGEVKVISTSSDKKRFETLDKVYLCKSDNNFTKENSIELSIDSVKYFKNQVILKFKNINRIEDVEKYVHYNLWVDRDNSIKLNEGEYFVADIIGLDVEDEEGNKLGKVIDCMETGANDVYVVGNDTKEIYIPAIKDCILNIDFEKNIMKVHLLEGL